MMEEMKVSWEDISFEIRVVLYRGIYSRILRLLEIHSSGDIYILWEHVDDAYIRMRKMLDGLAASSGFETLKKNLPSGLPKALHYMDADDTEFLWDLYGTALNQYKGEILRLYHDVVPQGDYSELLKTYFESHDKFLTEFEKNKRRVDKEWWDSVEQVAKQRAEMQPNSTISINVDGDVGGDLIVSGHDTHINNKDKGSRDGESDEEKKK
jgi:hypothetical protein